MHFWKYHGIGNDFIVVEDFAGDLLDEAPELAQAVCHRQFGIGGDGLVLITFDQGIHTMRIFNPDGSEAEMCGNAIRCVADHLFAAGRAHGTTVTINTVSGPKEIHRAGNLYAVDMGEPQFTGAGLPQLGGVQHVEAQGGCWDIYPISMGNPHGVVFVNNLAEIDLARLGPILETHPIWPAQANIEFVEVKDAGSLQVKVWERGAGPTLACGTGACASAVWAAKLGRSGRSVKVQLPGGDLEIRWETDNHVWMIGPAAMVFEGNYYGR